MSASSISNRWGWSAGAAWACWKASRTGRPPKKPDADAEKALAGIDWTPALRNGNGWYDRIAAAMRLKDRAEREQELDKIDRDLKALKAEISPPWNVAQILLGKDPPETKAGKAIGDILITLLVPAVRKVQQAYDRDQQVQQNVRIAFALAAYHHDHGRYPAQLDDLAPMYLAAVPDDLFSGKPLVYRPTEKGYLFYSVGVNGKDEGGRSRRRRPRRRRPARVHTVAGAETDEVRPSAPPATTCPCPYRCRS